jgi:hypothetical protein
MPNKNQNQKTKKNHKNNQARPKRGGPGPKPKRAPVSRSVAAGYTRIERSHAGSERRRETGSIYLGQIRTGTSTGSEIFISALMAPATLAPSRLAQYAGMFSRWRLRGMTLRYEPSCGTSTSGSLIMWFDNDPTTPIPSVSSRGEVCLNHQCASIFSVWSPTKCTWKAPFVDKPFYTAQNPDLREFSAGRIVVCTDTLLPNNTYLGRVYLDFDVEFFDQSLNPSLTAGLEQERHQIPAGANVNLTQGTGYNITDLVMDNTTLQNSILYDPVEVIDLGVPGKGYLVPAGQWRMQESQIFAKDSSGTSTDTWGNMALQIYTPEGEDITASQEYLLQFDNTGRPTSKQEWVCDWDLILNLTQEAVVSLTGEWAGDTITGAEAWTWNDLAPVGVGALKLASAFFTNVQDPGVSVRSRPGGITQIVVNRQKVRDSSLFKRPKKDNFLLKSKPASPVPGTITSRPCDCARPVVAVGCPDRCIVCTRALCAAALYD